MEKKSRLFIYDRKEMGVLVLLGVMIALFAFTLGVHLGKRVGPSGLSNLAHESGLLETREDKLPSRQDIAEKTRGASITADEVLSRTLHDEVGRTGVKLDQPRAVELPKDTVADTRAKTPKADSKISSEVASIPAAQRPSPVGNFTLQVGSYPSLTEARDHIDALEALGIRPFLRGVDLAKKGKWYRVYLGGYQSKEEAEEAGARYKAKNVIESFILSNRVD